ncbi:Uncharacterised protein [Mycobacteroides abscessus subsp. abscessus]|nr:Uncharacterised protein [Mycobacteroides abscessus subsp. abscessus]
MRDDEILAAGLTDEPRVGVVPVDIGTHLAPQMLERASGAGEVNARQPRIGQCHIGYRDAIPVQQVDHTGRQPGRLEEFQGEMA